MQNQTTKTLHPLMWTVGIAVILLCAAGIFAIMGWIPTGSRGDNLATPKVDKPAEIAVKPAEMPASPAEAPGRPPEKVPKPMAEKTYPAPLEAHSPPPPPAQMAKRSLCLDCGTITSINAVTDKGEGSGLGAVGGAVVGGLLGNQIGGGTGKGIATVVGAVGGAVAGNQVEKTVKSTKSYNISVRFEDGSSRTFHDATPSWRVGDRVKVVNGALVSNN